MSIRQAGGASVGLAISGSMHDQGYVEMKQKRGEQPCGRRRAPCSHQERSGCSTETRAARARPCKAKRPPPRQLPQVASHVGMPPLTRHVHRNVIAPAALARAGAHMKIERGTPCRRARSGGRRRASSQILHRSRKPPVSARRPTRPAAHCSTSTHPTSTPPRPPTRPVQLRPFPVSAPSP